MPKESYIRTRISTELKEKLQKKWEEDGISESEFLIACAINYLGIQTVPSELVNEDD